MNTAVDYLIFPEVLKYVDFDSMLTLQCVSKSLYNRILNASDSLYYWSILCDNYARKYGLYHQTVYKLNIGDAKRHIMVDLYPSRHKWRVESDRASAKNFKVRTMCRFRPGGSSSGKVLLPLHQFLKIRRENQKKALENPQGIESNSSNNSSKFGQQVPERYLDPILGIIMKEPVQLTPSGKVVDRSVGVQCVVHGGKDPFTNEKLSATMLTPLPDLAVEIADWMKNNMNFDPSVSVAELKPLIDEGCEVNPLLLEALMDAQQLACTSNKLFLDTKYNNPATRIGGEFDTATVGEGSASTPESEEGGETETSVPSNDVDGAETERDTVEEVGRKEEVEEMVTKKAAFTKLRSSDSPKVVDVNVANSFVSMHIPGQGVTSFHYGKVFHEHGGTGKTASVKSTANTQESVFGKAAKESILSVMNGYNACLLCYGQTGSGKTYTLFGELGALEEYCRQHERDFLFDPNTGACNICMPDSTGIVVRAFHEILEAKQQLEANQGLSVQITAQFIEIYNEKCTDLLNGKNVLIRRDTGEPVGATTAPVESMREVLTMLNAGQQRKKFAATAMNDHSSRSHTALILTVNQSKAGGDTEEAKHCTSSLFLVDLAGSERIKKSKAQGVQKNEAVGINRSLLVLGKVISSLTEGKAHIPYLESKLTTLLKQAFGGNCRTNVLIHCRPDEVHSEETLQSMRFGERCGMILNTIKTAATSKESTLATIDEALARMEKQVSSLRNNGKEHLPAYQQVCESLQTLQLKRKAIAAI